MPLRRRACARNFDRNSNHGMLVTVAFGEKAPPVATHTITWSATARHDRHRDGRHKSKNLQHMSRHFATRFPAEVLFDKVAPCQSGGYIMTSNAPLPPRAPHRRNGSARQEFRRVVTSVSHFGWHRKRAAQPSAIRFWHGNSYRREFVVPALRAIWGASEGIAATLPSPLASAIPRPPCFTSTI